MHHFDLVAGSGEVVGEFRADEAAAEDRHLAAGFERSAEGRVILQIVHREHFFRTRAGESVRNRVGAQGENQLAVAGFAIAPAHLFADGIDGGDAGIGQDLGLEVGRHLLARRVHQLFGTLARRQRVGQVGLGVEVAVVRADQRDRRGLVAFPELAQHGVAREA